MKTKSVPSPFILQTKVKLWAEILPAHGTTRWNVCSILKDCESSEIMKTSANKKNLELKMSKIKKKVEVKLADAAVKINKRQNTEALTSGGRQNPDFVREPWMVHSDTTITNISHEIEFYFLLSQKRVVTLETNLNKSFWCVVKSRSPQYRICHEYFQHYLFHLSISFCLIWSLFCSSGKSQHPHHSSYLHKDVSLRIFSNNIFNVCSSWTQTKLEPPLFCLIMCKKYESIFFSRKKLQTKNGSCYQLNAN